MFLNTKTEPSETGRFWKGGATKRTDISREATDGVKRSPRRRKRHEQNISYVPPSKTKTGSSTTGRFWTGEATERATNSGLPTLEQSDVRGDDSSGSCAVPFTADIRRYSNRSAD